MKSVFIQLVFSARFCMLFIIYIPLVYLLKLNLGTWTHYGCFESFGDFQGLVTCEFPLGPVGCYTHCHWEAAVQVVIAAGCGEQPHGAVAERSSVEPRQHIREGR